MRKEAIRLRVEERLSNKEIANRLKMSCWTVADWVRPYPLTQEERRKKMSFGGRKPNPEFDEREVLTAEEDRLKWFGLGLYCGEGGKTSNAVDFTNSDPKVLSLFLTFLRRIFRVKESRLRVRLQLKNFHDIRKMTRFWSRVVGIPTRQFGKPTITKSNPKKDWKKYTGTCKIRYCDQTLLKRLLELIESMGVLPSGIGSGP